MSCWSKAPKNFQPALNCLDHAKNPVKVGDEVWYYHVPHLSGLVHKVRGRVTKAQYFLYHPDGMRPQDDGSPYVDVNRSSWWVTIEWTWRGKKEESHITAWSPWVSGPFFHLINP